MIQEIIYFITTFLDISVLCFITFRKKVNNVKLNRYVRGLVSAISVSMLSCVPAVILPNMVLAEVFQIIHYIAMEWMLIFLLLFLEIYGCRIPMTKLTKGILICYAALCTVAMLLNPVFHHVTRAEKQPVNGILVNVYTNYSPYYQFHMYFVFFLLLMSVSLLIWSVINTVKLYRQKYLYALIVLLITLVCDTVFHLMNFIHNFAIYGYALIGYFFAFYALYYKPKSVITRTLSFVVEDSKNGVICFDPEDKCIYINDVIMSFIKDEELNMDFLKHGFLKLLGSSTFQESDNRRFLREVEFEDRKHFLEITFSKLYDDEQNYTGSYFTLYDKTEDTRKLEKEHYKASHDALTGLYSKDYFYECILNMQKEYPEKQYLIVTLDIRDFKLINDIFGYDRGNELLILLANKLKESLPVEDSICARLVSDHFAFCIPEELFDEEMLKSEIQDMKKIMNNTEFTIYIHAGIYPIQAGDTDVSLMCDRANMALRTIKNDYNMVCAYYDDGMMNQVIKSKHMISEFDTAIEEKQFVMYLQPQVDTDGNVLGAEALVRWKHPEKGMISPGEFIPIFEECGLIQQLDLYIWEEAAKKLQEWKKQGNEKYYISVNISARDFYYLDIYESFTGLVEKYDIAPQNLKLEITETAIMQEVDKQLSLLSRLQSYGFHVEIDDFGSGYSSLNMLKNIQADVLKIDMGFLQEVQNQNRTRIILGMVVSLAKQLKMLVITEGVETKEQVEYLTGVGCDMFQGYYFARPVPVEEFEQRYYKSAAV